MKIYDTFHVSLLEPSPTNLRKNNKIHKPQVENNEQEEDIIQVEASYEVEKILNSREENDGQLYYLIK